MKPYNDTDGKKEQVRAMFDGIARRYDLLNHLLSLGVDRGWRRRVVRAVRAERPRSVLDMATGTADLAIMLAKSCPGARVVGVDLSERMLAVGRAKVERESLSERIELVQGDAESAAYGREAFDAATVAFGVRNFEDIPGGLAGLVFRPQTGRKTVRARVRHAARQNFRDRLPFLLPPGPAPVGGMGVARREGVQLSAPLGGRVPLRRGFRPVAGGSGLRGLRLPESFRRRGADLYGPPAGRV